MNHLIAKVKDKDAPYRKVMSEVSVYNLPDNIQNGVEYVPGYKLEDDEWYCVSAFSEKKFCIELLKSEFDTTNYNSIDPKKLDRIFVFISEQK